MEMEISICPARDESGLSEEMKPADAIKSEFDKSARDYEMLFKPWLKIGASREYLAR